MSSPAENTIPNTQFGKMLNRMLNILGSDTNVSKNRGEADELAKEYIKSHRIVEKAGFDIASYDEDQLTALNKLLAMPYQFKKLTHALQKSQSGTQIDTDLSKIEGSFDQQHKKYDIRLAQLRGEYLFSGSVPKDNLELTFKGERGTSTKWFGKKGPKPLIFTKHITYTNRFRVMLNMLFDDLTSVEKGAKTIRIPAPADLGHGSSVEASNLSGSAVVGGAGAAAGSVDRKPSTASSEDKFSSVLFDSVIKNVNAARTKATAVARREMAARNAAKAMGGGYNPAIAFVGDPSGSTKPKLPVVGASSDEKMAADVFDTFDGGSKRKSILGARTKPKPGKSRDATTVLELKEMSSVNNPKHEPEAPAPDDT